MDSDLVEAVDKLKAILDKRAIRYTLTNSTRDVVDSVKQRLKLPPRYRSFLLEANPAELQTITPVESIQFVPVDDLLQEQVGFSLGTDLKPLAPGKEALGDAPGSSSPTASLATLTSWMSPKETPKEIAQCTPR